MNSKCKSGEMARKLPRYPWGDDQARAEVEEITEVSHGFVLNHHCLRFSALHFALAALILPIPLQGGYKMKN
jgi:hypothetical protein